MAVNLGAIASPSNLQNSAPFLFRADRNLEQQHRSTYQYRPLHPSPSQISLHPWVPDTAADRNKTLK